MLKAELLKFTKGKFLIFVSLMMVIISFYVSEREGASRYGLFTKTDILNYYDGNNIDLRMAASNVAKYWELDRDWVESQATDMFELAETIHEVQFSRLLNVSLGFILFASFFAPYYIGMDFKTRLWNNMLYVGYRRASIYWSRIVAYFTITILVSLITTFALIFLFAGTIFTKVSAGFIWASIFRKALFDAAIMSVPLVWIYLFKAAVFPSLITLGIELAAWIGLVVYGAPLETAPESMSSVVTPLLPVYLPTFGLYDIPTYVPVIVIAVCVLIGWALFEHCDLE
ncbi:MAG: hypothetical protein LBN43_09650 [Oscillospiraceae bacterium]|jgi:hypothetical protein|nr:hypothetical protein [Oscillospiraceae bacterium]